MYQANFLYSHQVEVVLAQIQALVSLVWHQNENPEPPKTSRKLPWLRGKRKDTKQKRRFSEAPSIGVRTHLAGAVLCKLVEPQMSCSYAVRKDPQQDNLDADAWSQQRNEKHTAVAKQVAGSLHPDYPLSRFWLVNHQGSTSL